MQRFSANKKRDFLGLRELLLPVLSFGILIFGLVWGANNVFVSVESEQLKAAEQAVRRATVQCYALEGSYPPSLDYLTENYGLLTDRTKYIIHYEKLGGNLMPQISVFPIEQGAGAAK